MRAAIDAKTEFCHSVGFIDVGAGEKLDSSTAKDLLRGCEDAAVVVAAAGHVEQTKQHALGADAQGIVEISGNALAHEGGGDVGALDLGKYGRDGLGGGGDGVDGVRVKERHRSRARGEASTGMDRGQTEGSGNAAPLFQLARRADAFDFAQGRLRPPLRGATRRTYRKVLGQVGLELAVVGMDGRAQGGFGGRALAEELEDALNIAHAVGIVDVGHGGERFGVGDVGLGAGKTLEAAFERVERNILLRFEQQCELAAFAAEALGFEELGDAFVQPGRATAAGKLRNE